MKTKTKIIASLEIAVVLCSLFLVATLPAAAITNYESGITNYEETASEDDYVLGIYGNANEDDTIDMRDLTYVKLIFFGKKPETELADAKYDGKINPLDFIQIKLIIVGKEKELTIVDSADRIVTVSMPVERVVVMGVGPAEAIYALGAKDKMVGITQYIANKLKFWPDLQNKPKCGGTFTPDYEKIFDLKPQVVITYSWTASDLEEKLEPAGIKLLLLNCDDPDTMARDLRIMGIILCKDERAGEYIHFIQEYLNTVQERVEELEAEEKKRVYIETSGDYKSAAEGTAYHSMIVRAGGINIFADADAKYPVVDPEAILRKNPQLVLRKVWSSQIKSGYGVTDASEMATLMDNLISRPGWSELEAVKNNDVYLMSNEILFGARTPIGTCYLAKWLYPDKFRGIDPAAFHKEWLEEFYGVEYKGIWVYPEPS